MHLLESQEARKFGLGLILASQQTTDFSMVALSNTATKLVFQTLDPMGTISRLLVQHTSINLTANEVKETLKALLVVVYVCSLTGTCFSISSLNNVPTIENMSENLGHLNLKRGSHN